MSLYDTIRSRQQPQSIQQALQQIRNDPGSYLRQAGFNVSPGTSDPRQLVSQLMSSGQIPQGRLQMAQAMMQRLGLRI